MTLELAPMELAQIESLQGDLKLLDDRIAAVEKGLLPRLDGDLRVFRHHREQVLGQLKRVSGAGDRT